MINSQPACLTWPLPGRSRRPATHPQVAHLLWAVARSEEVRIQLMHNNFIACSQESDEIHVCPRCGLIINGELPACCPVDGIPGEKFEEIA